MIIKLFLSLRRKEHHLREIPIHDIREFLLLEDYLHRLFVLLPILPIPVLWDTVVRVL